MKKPPTTSSALSTEYSDPNSLGLLRYEEAKGRSAGPKAEFAS